MWTAFYILSLLPTSECSMTTKGKASVSAATPTEATETGSSNTIPNYQYKQIVPQIRLKINCVFVKSWHFFGFFTGIIIYKGGRALDFSFPARLRGGSNGLPPFCVPGPYGPGDMPQSLHEGLEVSAGGISRKPAIAPTRGTKIQNGEWIG